MTHIQESRIVKEEASLPKLITTKEVVKLDENEWKEGRVRRGRVSSFTVLECLANENVSWLAGFLCALEIVLIWFVCMISQSNHG